MATTSNTYTGNGSNRLFSITFPYLDTADVDVYLNGVLQTVTTQYSFANATTVEFVTAPSNGATVLLSRSTNDTTLAATFFAGSSIRAADLNDNFDQVLYLAQETNNNVANAVAGQIPDGTITSAKIADDTIVNADVNASAGIVATKLAFTQAGTGATARTIDSKLKDTVSVKDFGAVGDGVADDTAAITACIAAAGDGGTILFPADMECLITSQLLFNVPNQRVIGYGATVIKGTGFSGNCLIRIGAVNVTIEGLYLNGVNKANAPTGIDGIITSANVASGFTAKNLKVRNCLFGLSPVSNSNITIDSCNIAATFADSIRAYNSAGTQAHSNIKIINNTLNMSDNDPATTNYICLQVWGTGNYFTNDVVVANNTMTQVIDPTDSAAECCEFRFLNNAVFEGNVCSGGSMMISVGASNNVAVNGNTGINQTFYSVEVGGLSTSGGATVNQPCTNVAVTGNSIKGGNILNYALGIQGTYPSKGITMSGNSIEGTTLYGIFVNDQWDDIAITGNRITITDTVSPSQYGVFLQGSATAITEVSIVGNTLNGNSQGEKAVYLLNVQDATVSGNLCKNWTQNGVLVSGAAATCSDITIAGNSFKGLGATAIQKSGTIGDYVLSYANTSYRRSGTTATNDLNLNLDLIEAWGTGTPEGAVTAGVGSIYHRTNGGAATSLYVKEAGTGNTGWVGK
jgi:hypothetical protein